MTFFSELIFLVTLAGFHLFLLGMLKGLDALGIESRQKMFVFKTGLTIFLATPVVFVLFKIFSVNTVQIELPPLKLDPLGARDSGVVTQPEVFAWAAMIFKTYVAGVAASLLLLLYRYFSTWKWLANSTENEWNGTRVRIGEFIESPLSFGFLFPQIYFPKDSETLWSPREVQISLQHEKTHIAHHDPFWKVISLTVRSILFFAPWSYALHRKLELEMEIYCDETTRAVTGASLEEYGNLLLAMMVPKNSKMQLTTNMTDSTLKRRFLAMKSRTIQRPIVTVLMSLFLLLFGTASVATSSGIGEKKATYHIVSEIYLNGRKVSSPRIITNAGEEASITQGGNDDNYLSLTFVANDVATPSASDAILMDFTINYKFSGIDTHERMKLILLPKKQGRFSFTDKDGRVYEMRVVVDRIL